MPYDNPQKKKSQFTTDNAVTDSSTFDFVKSGVNKKTTWSNLITLFQQQFGLGMRVYETESAMVADSALVVGDYAIVEENYYAIYKIGNLVAGTGDVTLANALVATQEGKATPNEWEAYSDVRALKSSAFMDGETIDLTNDGIAGQFVVKTGTVTDNGGTLITFDDDLNNRYVERDFQGLPRLSWFEPTYGGVVDNSSKIQSCVTTHNGCLIDGGIVGWSHVDVDTDNVKIETEEGASLFMIETASPYGFDCSGTTGCVFDIVVDGDKSSFTYAENTSSTDSLNSRFRYAVIYASSITDVYVKLDASNLFGVGVYFKGGIVSEKATSRGIKLYGRCTDSYFEYAKLVKCGDVFADIYTENNTNSYVSNTLVGNGFITTVCDNITIAESSYFGTCDGTGSKFESINGLHTVGAALYEDNGFHGIHCQESGKEQGDIASNNERLVLNGPTVRRAKTYALSLESSSVNAPANVSGWIVDDACARSSVFISGSDVNLKIITKGTGTTDVNGDLRNRSAAIIQNEGGNPINNVNLDIDWDAFDDANTIDMAVLDIGGQSNSGSVMNGIKVKGVVKNHVFRGVFGQNNVNAKNVNVEGLKFVRTPRHEGTAQAGTATTITLAADASATDDYYNGNVIFIVGGTGIGDAVAVTDYVGSTKVATVASWGVATPDATSIYKVWESGTSTYDVYVSCNIADVNWTVKDCTSPTGMLVRCNGTRGEADVQGITLSWPNAEAYGRYSALQYYIIADGGRSAWVDRCGRMNFYVTSIPTYDSDKHQNKDIAWNTASSTPEYWYLANTTWTASN